MNVNANSLSPYQIEVYKKAHPKLPRHANSWTDEAIDEYIKSHPSKPTYEKSPKLIANWNDKVIYVIHIRNLKKLI